MFKLFKKLNFFNKKDVSQSVDENEDDFSIEMFQLENLINNNISFSVFNLSSNFLVKDGGDFVSSFLKLSQAGTELEIKEELIQMDKSKPVVLICEKGDQSRDLALQLQKEGFINSFFVKGGIISLIESNRISQ